MLFGRCEREILEKKEYWGKMNKGSGCFDAREGGRLGYLNETDTY